MGLASHDLRNLEATAARSERTDSNGNDDG